MPPIQPPKHPVSDDALLADAIPIPPEELEAAEGSAPEHDGIPQIDLVAPEDAPPTGGRIQKFGAAAVRHEDQWNRTPNITGQGAIHVRTFFAKLRSDAIEHMDHQINEWLDAHPQYEVKLVTTAIGELTGKLKEPALFVNVWV
jgi:hypothetical protein